jgi:hypothetical protein
MNALNKEQAVALVLSAAPEFRPVLESFRAEWADEALGLCSEFSELSDFVIAKLHSGATEGLQVLFEAVERLMVEGDEEVKDAAATCFLENLMNATPDRISPAAFVPLLGAESRVFCRSWDEFCGLRTPGLWPDESGQ